MNVKLYSNGKMNLHVCFYVSISFSISPPNSLVVFVTLTKVKAVLA